MVYPTTIATPNTSNSSVDLLIYWKILKTIFFVLLYSPALQSEMLSLDVKSIVLSEYTDSVGGAMMIIIFTLVLIRLLLMNTRVFIS